MQLQFIIIILLFIIGTKPSDAQSNELYTLDSAAFAALESNAPDISERANQLLEAGQKANASTYIINAYTILGIVNKNKGYYVTAVEFYNKALDVAKDANDLGRVSACYNNIGTVYQIQENYSKALDYFQKSLEIEEKLDNPLQKSIRLYNIGDMYREMDSLTLALSNFNSSLMIEKKYQNDVGIVYALLGVADIYLKLDKVTDAEISLIEAENYLEDSYVEPRILYGLLKADALTKRNEFASALNQLEIVKELSQTHDFKIYLADINEKSIWIREQQEEYKKRQSYGGHEINFSHYLSWVYYPLAVLLLILFVVYFRRSWKKRFSKTNTIAPSQNEVPIFQLINDSGKTLLSVPYDKILCFSANDNYVITQYLSEDGKPQKSMERASLKKIEKMLGPNDAFFRVHKSHIIHKKYVDSIQGKAQAYKIRLQHLDSEIPVSRNFDISQISK